MKPSPYGNFADLTPIGVVHSAIKDRADAPRQGYEGAPNAAVEIDEKYSDCLHGLAAGEFIILLTWFHQSDRSVHQVHPRGDRRNPITGVFATRSPDRPNPIGLHRVRVLEISGRMLKVGPLEALDGTPILDIKPVLDESHDS